MNRWGDASLQNDLEIHTWIHCHIKNTKMFHDEKSREGGGGERSNKWVREHIYALGFPLYINWNNFRICRVKLLEGSLCMGYSTTHRKKGTQERTKGEHHIWSRWFPFASFMVSGALPTLLFETGIMFRG